MVPPNWFLQPGARLKPGRDFDAMPSEPPDSADVIVVGAGVIGLSIGWRLARQGLHVILFERETAGAGASGAATGMLAAAAELEPGGQELLALALESQRLWPEFRAALEAAADLSIDYRDHGTLLVAIGREEVDRLRFRHEFHRRNGVGTVWLSGAEARAKVPGLRPSIIAGSFCPDDHQVDPRRMIEALRRAFVRAGGRLVENHAVERLDLSGGRVAGVETRAGNCRAKIVVLATGAWITDRALLPGTAPPPVRPLKGQALALRMTRDTNRLSHVVWTEQVHLAPKSDGRLIVGATVEERGFDTSVTAGGVLALLDGARRALPSIEDMPLEAVWTGLRPTSIDDAPILGAVGTEGLLVAAGHHRNGVLLAPATAEAIAALILDGTIPEPAAPFGLERFLLNVEPTP